MGLFDKLYRSSLGEEDFFTKLFAALLHAEPERQVAFLNKFVPTLCAVDGLRAGTVETQAHYPALAGHSRASRPDLRLRPATSVGRVELLIESKVSAAESDSQLLYYANHLAATPDVVKRVLLYITRDYEPKSAPRLDIEFYQFRWYEVYQFLGTDEIVPTWLSVEIRQFMEKSGMSQNLKFSPTDALALRHFHQAEKMMWHTLDGVVSERLQQLGGKASCKPEDARKLYWNSDRYILTVSQRTGEEFWIGVGYRLAPEIPSDYPLVGVILESNSSQHNAAYAAVLRMIQADSGAEWQGFDLDRPEETEQYPRLWRSRPLHDFLQGDDHVGEVRRYLLECLDEVDRLKSRYPDLPWI